VFQDFGNFIDTGLGDFIFPETSESDVKDSTIFRGIDMLSGEHLVTVLLNTGFTDQFEKVGENGLCDQVFGVVEEKSVGGIGRGHIFLGEL
jgi:hypothetical protein